MLVKGAIGSLPPIMRAFNTNFFGIGETKVKGWGSGGDLGYNDIEGVFRFLGRSPDNNMIQFKFV